MEAMYYLVMMLLTMSSLASPTPSRMSPAITSKDSVYQLEDQRYEATLVHFREEEGPVIRALNQDLEAKVKKM